MIVGDNKVKIIKYYKCNKLLQKNNNKICG